jgi:hypothetical protein
MQGEDVPETIDTKYVAEFLEEREEALTKAKAQNTAFTLMLKLMEVPGVMFFCRYCHNIRGVCRCPAHGRESHGPHGKRWVYSIGTGPWLCSVESLLHLPDETINTLGTKAQVRLKSLIWHLKQQ